MEHIKRNSAFYHGVYLGISYDYDKKTGIISINSINLLDQRRRSMVAISKLRFNTV
jgi:hypothetical protein